MNEIMDLELCCEEKVFKESRDIIEGLEFLRRSDQTMLLFSSNITNVK